MRNLFGSAKSELMPGAKNAVETCLSVRAGESVALIADEVSKPVAASLAAALEQLRRELQLIFAGRFWPSPDARSSRRRC